jgi:outer membrane protein assembly factor BamB
MRNKHTNSVLWKGAIYGFDEKTLTCLDPTNGEAKWTQSGMGMGALMLAEGKLIILSEKGELVIAEANSDAYKELSRGQVVRGNCWPVPVLANGRIFAHARTGQLSCSTFK